MGFIEDITGIFVNPIKGYAIPESTFIVIGVAVLLSLMTTGANRFLVDYKRVASYRREFMTWQQAVKKARKDGDEKQLDKLMKRQAAVMKMSSRATLEQMKTTAIIFIPFLLLYNVLITAFPFDVAVAFSPIMFPGANTGFLSVVYWYFLSSFAISIPLSRLFGVQTFSLTPTSGTR
ncbi:MAG TPA: EMC3/TMCO1 family protein [Candidatus Bathyarchaeia archaeon]